MCSVCWPERRREERKKKEKYDYISFPSSNQVGGKRRKEKEREREREGGEQFLTQRILWRVFCKLD